MSKSPKKDDKIFLDHILECIEYIETYTNGIAKTKFTRDQKLQDALMRRIGIIGEATKNLPKSFREKYPDIDWEGIAGMRNVLIHEYFGIKLDIIWGVIKEDIPILKRRIEKILEEIEN